MRFPQISQGCQFGWSGWRQVVVRAYLTVEFRGLPPSLLGTRSSCSSSRQLAQAVPDLCGPQHPLPANRPGPSPGPGSTPGSASYVPGQHDRPRVDSWPTGTRSHSGPDRLEPISQAAKSTCQWPRSNVVGRATCGQEQTCLVGVLPIHPTGLGFLDRSPRFTFRFSETDPRPRLVPASLHRLSEVEWPAPPCPTDGWEQSAGVPVTPVRRLRNGPPGSGCPRASSCFAAKTPNALVLEVPGRVQQFQVLRCSPSAASYRPDSRWTSAKSCRNVNLCFVVKPDRSAAG